MAKDYVEFYPSQEYIDKNWAPVKVPLSSFNSLAKSQAIAEKKGILAPETTKYYLPSALTEGRFDDYGVNQVDINYGTAKPKKAIDAELAGGEYQGQLAMLNMAMQQNPKQTKNWGPTVQAVTRLMNDNLMAPYDDRMWPGNERQQRLSALSKDLGISHLAAQEIEDGAKYDRYDPRNTENQDERAAIKTLALANKYHEAGGKAHGLKLWEMYNGAGPKAREYVGKLKHADEMMLHPANKDMYNAYLKLVQEHKKTK